MSSIKHLLICLWQRHHVGKTNFSIWGHGVEQVYLGYKHNKSQHRVRITCFSSKAGEGEKGNLLFTSHPIVRTQFAEFSEKLSQFYNSWTMVCRAGGTG